MNFDPRPTSKILQLVKGSMLKVSYVSASNGDHTNNHVNSRFNTKYEACFWRHLVKLLCIGLANKV